MKENRSGISDAAASANYEADSSEALAVANSGGLVTSVRDGRGEQFSNSNSCSHFFIVSGGKGVLLVGGISARLSKSDFSRSQERFGLLPLGARFYCLSSFWSIGV